jgi:TetR/AcrR family transcriptional regulator
MIDKKDNITQDRILDAARKVFAQRGFFGTRMQEIANEAGINKALLHYYYRSKDNLFESVFRDAAKKIFSRILPVINETDTIEEIIRQFIRLYIKALLENQYLPAFVLHEINHNPERLTDIFDEAINLDLGLIFTKLTIEMKEGRFIEMDPKHIIINMISLCIFPLIGAPIFKFKMKMSDDEYVIFLEQRADILPDYFINSIRK